VVLRLCEGARGGEERQKQDLVSYYYRAGAGAGAAFLCISYRGKLLQHTLIGVQCTNKSTRVPVSPVPEDGYSV
jgi:hypothetical protein